MVYCENKRNTKQVRENADKIDSISNSIINSINQRLIVILKTDEKLEIPNENIDISINLVAFKNLIDSLCPRDSILEKTSFNNLVFSKKELKDFTIYDLNLLKLKVKSLNFEAIKYLFDGIKINRFEPNKYKVAVSPKRKYLYLNDLFQADLFLFNIDTNFTFTVQFEKETIQSKNGKVIYIDSNSVAAKKVIESCVLKMISPATDDTLSFPFKMKYQFIKK